MIIKLSYYRYLPKRNTYVRSYDGKTKWMCVLIEDDEKIPKVDSNHTCLVVISLDSALKKDESYYLEVFLKECKYIEKKVIKNIKKYN